MPENAPHSPQARRQMVRALVLVLAVAGVVVAAAVALTVRQAPVYTSTSVVLIDLEATGVTRAPAMGTEREVATSLLVAESAARGLLDEDPAELLRNVSVTVPVDTNVLHFAFDGPSPEAARGAVSAFVDAYVNYRSSGAFTGPQVAPVAATVISPADLPRKPSKPNWLVNIGTAVLLGLCLGVAAGYRQLLAALRADPMPGTAGVDDLGLLPIAPLSTLAEGNGPPQHLEPYRRLRTHVLPQLGKTGPVPALLVTTPHEGQHTLAVAVQLGAALTRSGCRTVVLLLGGDLRALKALEIEAAPGLSDHLAGGGAVQDVLVTMPIPSLSVLPPGSDGRTSDVLAGHGLAGVLEQLAGVADVVVVDAGNALTSTTALEAARTVPDTLLVLRQDEAPGQLQAAVAELRRAGAQVLGAAVAVQPGRRVRRRAQRVAQARGAQVHHLSTSGEPSRPRPQTSAQPHPSWPARPTPVPAEPTPAGRAPAGASSSPTDAGSRPGAVPLCAPGARPLLSTPAAGG